MPWFSWFNRSDKLHDELKIVQYRLDLFISTLINRSNSIMATLEELQSSLNNLSLTITNERAQVQAALALQSEKIDELVEQIANTQTNAPITPAQLDGLMAAIDSISVAVDGIYSPSVAPDTPVTA